MEAAHRAPAAAISCALSTPIPPMATTGTLDRWTARRSPSSPCGAGNVAPGFEGVVKIGPKPM